MFSRMNDLVIQHIVVIPVLWRSGVGAAGARLRGMDLSGWDSTFRRLPHWDKQA
jgi:peptide/nickel transport system substrate-binding protein